MKRKAITDEILSLAKDNNAAIFALVVTKNGVTAIQSVHQCHLPFKLEKEGDSLKLVIDKDKLTDKSTDDVTNFSMSMDGFIEAIDKSMAIITSVYLQHQIEQIFKQKVHEKENKVDGVCFECQTQTTGVVRLGTAEGEVRASLCADCAERIGFHPDLLEDQAGGSCGCDNVCEGKGIHPEGEKGLHGKADIHGATGNESASKSPVDPSNN